MMTPTICTIVASRQTQSSVSYADANHVWWIQAQLTENAASRSRPDLSRWWPSAT